MAPLPLRVQLGAVILMFVAASAVLWTTSAGVVAREGRRANSKEVLDRAGTALSRQGAPILATAPRWPYDQDRREWDELDRRLARESDAVMRRFEGIEGGYFLRDYHRFLGTSRPHESGQAPPKKKKTARSPSAPPPRETDLIEIQVDAAIRKNQVLFVVETVPPSTVAIRTAPVSVDGRVVAATWTMTRLVDPLFLDRSTRGYRLAAGLALGGIALALALMIGLAGTIRRQAAERDQLQTELRRSERLAALGKLLAGVAHEVRNPLAGIRSTVQLWQRGIGPDDESFEGLVSEVDRLEGIVAQLLQFSRADARDLIPGDLNAVVAEAARLASGLADVLGVRVVLDLVPETPPVALAAPALIQVLRNLATNALQAMPDGGVLTFSTRLDLADARVEARVADTGPGLAPEALAHLFEPFFTTKPEGTGLGLAIAREIALSHRGELRAEPRPDGPGAVLALSLPILVPSPRGLRRWPSPT